MTSHSDDVLSELQRGNKKALRRLTILTVALYLALVGMGVWVYLDSANKRSDLAKVATTTNAALCTLRADLAQRVRSSEQFLADHPRGIPGVPVATIRSGIVNQKRTVKALSGLNCGGT